VHRWRAGHRPAAWAPVAVAGCAALAALTLLAPSQPTYDPWAWLLWGREVASLNLSTVEGPAFKPLPVAVTALLSAAGAAAPALWLVIVRTASFAAIGLGAAVAYELTGSRRAAGAGAVAVLALDGWAWHTATGTSEPLLVAVGLAALLCGLRGRHAPALALAVACALLRTECWPFAAVYALWLWRTAPGLRPWLAAGAVAVPALWLVPEWLGSGDVLRSSDRARIPNPGQPATESRPALASLREAAQLPWWPLLLAGLPGARGRALRLAGAGAAWIALVALMAEAGYSGEPRYALPGAALLAVGAAAGVARLRRGVLMGAVVVAALVTLPHRVDGAADQLRHAADDARLYGALDDAVQRAGGRAALRECGPPVVGRLRGPALAYALGVQRRAIGFDARAGGTIFRSRIRTGAPVMPAAARGPVIARSTRWEVRCAPAGDRRAGAVR
jgi:hypothetical protein